MRRLQLVELEDLPWLPAVVRDAGTAYLRLVQEISGQAAQLAPRVADALARSRRAEVVDLGSGGGGPVVAIARTLAAEGVDVRVTLTDRYPNAAAFESLAARSPARVDYELAPVDARAVPERLRGLRTLFNAFHHFPPELARAVLQGAVDAREPILVAETLSRHPLAIASVLFAPLAVMLLVPFLRPFRWSWLALTYVVPVIPLFVLWDGFVSCLRIYSPGELRAMVGSLRGGDAYDWDIDSLPLPPAPVPGVLCVGIPKD